MIVSQALRSRFVHLEKRETELGREPHHLRRRLQPELLRVHALGALDSTTEQLVAVLAHVARTRRERVAEPRCAAKPGSDFQRLVEKAATWIELLAFVRQPHACPAT